MILRWTVNIGVVASLREISVRPSVNITGVRIFMAFDSREFHQKLSKNFSVRLGGAVDLHEVPAFDDIVFTFCVGSVF